MGATTALLLDVLKTEHRRWEEEVFELHSCTSLDMEGLMTAGSCSSHFRNHRMSEGGIHSGEPVLEDLPG